MLAIGGIAAPAAFASAAPDVAGRIAGRMLAVEARGSLAVAVVLILLLRHLARMRSQDAGAVLPSPELMFVLGTVFCTVAGHFAVQPMIEAARAGEAGALSFATLHAVSVAFYCAKCLLMLLFAWRLSRAR
jgi:hypothetical protein